MAYRSSAITQSSIVLWIILLGGLGGCAGPEPVTSTGLGAPSGGSLGAPSGGSLGAPEGGSLSSGDHGGPEAVMDPLVDPAHDTSEGEVEYVEVPGEEYWEDGDVAHGSPAEDPPAESHGIGHHLLFWLPNRLFDILDLGRARVRVGPGWTFSARVTELADINMGAHRSFFVGLHGPREAPVIPWPLGTERFEGVEVSVMDMTDAEFDNGPHYGPLEVGLGFQFLLIGADVGVALWEAVDLIAGIVFLDPQGDDL